MNEQTKNEQRTDESAVTYFVSGHRDLTAVEFTEHYAGEIRRAADEPGSRFVVGDSPGCDHMAQFELVSLGVSPDRITVFHMLGSPRKHVAGLPTSGGYLTDDERDSAMTAASNVDIAWVRDHCDCCYRSTDRDRVYLVCRKKRSSGTAKNLRRRMEYALDVRRGRADAARLQARATWPRMVLHDRVVNGCMVIVPLLPPDAEPLEDAIPVDPDVLRRASIAEEALRHAEEEYWRVQSELRSLQVEWQALKD